MHARATLVSSKRETEASKAKWDEAQAACQGEMKKMEQDIGQLELERKQYTSQVEARVLARYDRVRRAKAGTGDCSGGAGAMSGLQYEDVASADEYSPQLSRDG